MFILADDNSKQADQNLLFKYSCLKENIVLVLNTSFIIHTFTYILHKATLTASNLSSPHACGIRV